MTNQQILIQILHEVTGLPKKELRRLMKSTRSALPDCGPRLDRKRTDAEAKRLLELLREEKAGIRRWLAEGAALSWLEKYRQDGRTIN